jgi:fructokinase
VPRLLPRYVYAQTVTTALVRAKHGDASGVRGAAMLWML